MMHFSSGSFLMYAAGMQQHILSRTDLHTHHCSESSGWYTKWSTEWISLNDNAMSFLERRMYLGKLKPYLTQTCSFPVTDQLFDSSKKLVLSSGQWVALYNDCSYPNWIVWSTFFAKLKWHEVGIQDGKITVVLFTQRTYFGNRYNKVYSILLFAFIYITTSC